MLVSQIAHFCVLRLLFVIQEYALMCSLLHLERNLREMAMRGFCKMLGHLAVGAIEKNHHLVFPEKQCYISASVTFSVS